MAEAASSSNDVDFEFKRSISRSIFSLSIHFGDDERKETNVAAPIQVLDSPLPRASLLLNLYPLSYPFCFPFSSILLLVFSVSDWMWCGVGYR